MDNQETDRRLREVFSRNDAPSAPSAAGLVIEHANLRHAPRPGRRRGAPRLFIMAAAAAVVCIGLAVGVWQAVDHFGGDNRIVVITDDTMSPGPGGADSASLSKDEIQAMTFRNPIAGTSRAATEDEINRFIEYFSKAEPYSDDVGTTHPALIEVLFKSGATMSVHGGSEGFQTVGLQDKQYTQHNIRGEELGRLLEQIADETISPPLTSPAAAPNEGARSVSEQRSRFLTVSELAQGGSAIIRYARPPAPDWSAELIVYGKVVKVDPARWSTPDGERPSHDQDMGSVGSEEFPYKNYTTFYVEPAQITGTPRFGTPIAIMVPFHDELLAPGDEVLVFAEYAPRQRGYGNWKQDAYFSIQGVRGIYMRVGEQYLNIDSGQPCQSP